VTLAEFKSRAELVLTELFLEGDLAEARLNFTELGAVFFSYVYVRRALLMAMGRGNRERELVSRLLSQLYGDGRLSMEQVGKGFESLFETIDDVAVDVHDARPLAAKFLARAVADEILPPAFLTDPLVMVSSPGLLRGGLECRSRGHIDAS
jgi:programmed cell death protein 4